MEVKIKLVGEGRIAFLPPRFMESKRGKDWVRGWADHGQESCYTGDEPIFVGIARDVTDFQIRALARIKLSADYANINGTIYGNGKYIVVGTIPNSRLTIEVVDRVATEEIL